MTENTEYTSVELDLPEMMDVSPETVASVEAAMDPSVRPPDDAQKQVDKKTQEVYYRWSELLAIESATREVSESGLTVFYVRGKVAPGATPTKNLGKNVHTRSRVNFKVLLGQEENAGHVIMNRLSLKTLTSLLKATEFYPSDASSKGLSGALLMHLFPKRTEIDQVVSPLVGKFVIATVVDRPNKGANAKYPRQTEVEVYYPVPEDSE